uniref:Bestrophin homolog n=1 Tax=Syphacia muris TaxID=451379 RepID=A0A0N5B1C9_9BILA
MTVSYNIDVIKTTSFSGFLKLQLRWRGSIWKQVITELILFTTAFAVLTVIYRTNILSEESRRVWDNFSRLFDQRMNYIPLTFMLGFFVTVIVGRWNDIFKNIGWIDNSALYVAAFIHIEKARIIRRNIIRYLVLTQTLIFRDISIQVRKRFPTMDTLLATGLMNEEEFECLNKLGEGPKYWAPILWSYSLLCSAREQGKIAGDALLNNILEQIRQFRSGLGRLCNYDWVPVPLVYPQVVFLAVRSYFLLSLIARQSVMVYPIVPFIMTALQYIFYVGWMKVAESLMNPLGEDDDDFECNYLIDRNLKVGLQIVDDAYGVVPRQQQSSVEMLYSAESATKPIFPLAGSVAGVAVDEIVMIPHVDVNGETESLSDDQVNEDKVKLVAVSKSDNGANDKSGNECGIPSHRPSVLEKVKRQFSR